jgi:drug/metabolite transporter (DMT)-like permease
LHLTRLDAWLLLMTFFWGSNFSVIKAALRELPGPAFNGLRMVLASLVFLAVIAWREPLARSLRAVPRRDWPAIVGLSLVGHGFYQYLFLGGVARTSASNSALIFGCTPITVSLLSAWLGHERPGWIRWAGTVLSLTGIYFVVSHGARQGASSLTGDAMIFAAMLCWAGYTVGTKPLLDRYSPIFITGLTMAIGTLVYAPFALLWLRGVDLTAVSAPAWAGIVYSALFSLVAAYVIWYTAVQKLGGGHTSMYSNIVPMVAMGVAAVVLGEPLTATKLAGAAAILTGVALTRLDRRALPTPTES